jgi:hypothetical protein
MRPTSKRISFQAHVLSGFCHGSHCLVSNAVALNAVVSVIFFAMGIQSPTVRADEAGDLAGADGERHPVQCERAAEPLVQPGDLDCRFHGRGCTPGPVSARRQRLKPG